MTLILRTADDLATSGDVTAAASSVVTALSAQLTAVAQQLTDLAVAGLDDVTSAQLTSALEPVLAAIAALEPAPSALTYGGALT